ncbi:S8 family serine peptidase [Chitinispirillales bacterium ANBcel5]|uniref:S8 family serine peptidase n=1 Tax=Cellulosispirillum alkaliphilum TaxID=3039283 RepID=UPI002A50EC96|nr:S8 family serine peptidase [Chitinispirillales bacterium ANBcel5]
MQTRITVTMLITLFFLSFPQAQRGARLGGTFDFSSRSLQKPDSSVLLRKRAFCSSTIRVLALVERGFDESAVVVRGWEVVTRSGELLTLQGCENDLHFIRGLEGVIEIQGPTKLFPQLDVAREFSAVDSVHEFMHTHPYFGLTGKDILVGVIDVEFDIYHPAFVDSAGNSRFVALWDQRAEGSGNSSFGYGVIKTGEQLHSDSSFGFDSSSTHGTSVTGVIAGGDRSGPYYGIAPEATIAAVKYGNNAAEIADAIRWIFSLADSMEVPGVINLSIGTHEGPHDGTSLIDRLIDSLSGPGRIIVGAAGNDGARKVHLSTKLSSQTQGTFVQPREVNGFQRYASAINVWGEPGENFSATVLVLDTVSMTYLEGSTTLRTRFGSFINADTILIPNSTSGASDTVIISAFSERSNTLNSKPNVRASLRSNNKKYWLGVSLSGSGKVNIWNTVNRDLRGLDTEHFFDGGNKSSIVEIGGTANRIISVGAYINRGTVTLWDSVQTTINSNPLDLAPWSSRGPTVDGRIKPDITAPGLGVVSVMSSAYENTANLVVWPDTETLYGRYQHGSGTSLSAPMVAGSVALMLQADPLLTPERAKEALKAAATTDELTGYSIPDNNWGSGRLNVWGAVSEITDFVITTQAQSTQNASLRPSFSILNRHIIIENDALTDQKVRLRGFDIRGRLQFSTVATVGEAVKIPSGISSGTLILHLEHNGRSHSFNVRTLNR